MKGEGAFRCNATTVRTFALFADLPPAVCERVARRLSTSRYARHQFVLGSAERDTDVRFIVSGSVRVCAYSEDGRQVQFEDLVAGTMFGELAAIDGGPRSADCFALEPTRIASMSAEHFRALVHEHPDVADAVLFRLVALARRQLQRVLEFSTTGVRQRVRLELLRMAASGRRGERGEISFDKVPTHADMAARISTHREAVSRELKSLEAAGVIVWRPGTHVILDVGRLARPDR